MMMTSRASCQKAVWNVKMEHKGLLALGASHVHLPQQSPDIVFTDAAGTVPFQVIMSCRCEMHFSF